jgi:hypothetical protein
MSPPFKRREETVASSFGVVDGISSAAAWKTDAEELVRGLMNVENVLSHTKQSTGEVKLV